MAVDEIQAFNQYKRAMAQAKQRQMPHDPNDESDVAWATKWHQKVIQDISTKVAKIQDPIWTQPQIRTLNDEINKLFRVKTQWERRIAELGGKDVSRLAQTGTQLLDKSTTGYRYFGRAKDLPGVRELLEQHVEPAKKTKSDLVRAVDAQYYGYMDEDDGILLEFESRQSHDAYMDNQPPIDLENVPSIKQVEQHLLHLRKQHLLERFLSDGGR